MLEIPNKKYENALICEIVLDVTTITDEDLTVDFGKAILEGHLMVSLELFLVAKL